MTIKCAESGCNSRFEPSLGHLKCLSHSPCVTKDWIYDPCRCMSCIDFFNSNFVGATSVERVNNAKIILASHIKKISSKARKASASLRFTSVVLEVRLRKQPLEFYTNMNPLVFGVSQSPHTMSESSPSSEGTPSEASFASGASSSSSRRSDILEAKLAQAQSVLALHGLSVDNPLHQVPVVTGSEPISEVIIRPKGSSIVSTSLESGFSSLPPSHPISVVSCSSAPISCSPMLTFSHSIPVSTVIAPSAPPPPSFSWSASLASPSFPMPPDAAPSSASLVPVSFSSSLPDASLSTPPISMSSPAPLDPAIPSSHPVPPSSLPPPPGFAPISSSPSLPVSIPLSFSQSSLDSFLMPPPPPPASPAPPPVSVVLPSSPSLPPAAPPVSSIAVAVSHPLHLPVSHPSAHSSASLAVHSHVSPTANLPPPPTPPPTPTPVSASASSDNARFGDLSTDDMVRLLFRRADEEGRLPISVDRSTPSSAVPGSGPAAVQGGFGVSRGSGVVSSSSPSGGGLGVGFPVTSTAAFASAPLQSNDGILAGPSGTVAGNVQEDDIVVGDGEVMSDEVPGKWSPWVPFDSSHEILFDGNSRSALFCRERGTVIPWGRISTCMDNGVEYFSVRSSSNPCSLKSKIITCSKNKCNPVFEKFPEYQVPIKDSEIEPWLNHFTHGASFDDSSLPRRELPPLFDKVNVVFAAIASKAKPPTFPLRPSCVFFLESMRPMMMGLPMAKFPLHVFSDEFQRGATDFVKPSKELVDDEFLCRMEFISISVVLSAFHAFSILFRASSSPSPLGAIMHSLFAGLRCFLDFCWSQAFLRFAKARSSLRRAAFVNPQLEVVSKLIISDPFSETLFSSKAKSEIESLLKGQNMSMGDVLNLTPAAKAAHVKQRLTFINALTVPSNPGYQGRKGPSYMFKGTQRRGSRSSYTPNRGGNNSSFYNNNKRGKKFRGQARFHRRPRGHRGGKQ